jgi:hypothetical protein
MFMVLVVLLGTILGAYYKITKLVIVWLSPNLHSYFAQYVQIASWGSCPLQESSMRGMDQVPHGYEKADINF